MITDILCEQNVPAKSMQEQENQDLAFGKFVGAALKGMEDWHKACRARKKIMDILLDAETDSFFYF